MGEVVCLTTYRNKRREGFDELSLSDRAEELRWQAGQHILWLLESHDLVISQIQPGMGSDYLNRLTALAQEFNQQIEEYCKTYRLSVHTQGTVYTILKE